MKNVRVIEPVLEDESPVVEPTQIPKSEPERVKIKIKRKSRGSGEPKSLSRLHRELRRHSDARKKTDLAVKDIEKQLTSLLLAHHSAIKELQKQVTQIQKAIHT